MLVHHKFRDAWDSLPDRVGEESAQQFYDHVAYTPGGFPDVNRSSFLRGKYAKPKKPGFSKTIHYEISGAGRINYQWNEKYKTHDDDQPHGVVWILAIDLGSH